ncbi:hypothetical protein HDU98_001229 [Podochytrium sp. JEL0797]|nr:hypothetical protein HDU98_001229 [Podochytrium sp. JEL0797]
MANQETHLSSITDEQLALWIEREAPAGVALQGDLRVLRLLVKCHFTTSEHEARKRILACRDVRFGAPMAAGGEVDEEGEEEFVTDSVDKDPFADLYSTMEDYIAHHKDVVIKNAKGIEILKDRKKYAPLPWNDPHFCDLHADLCALFTQQERDREPFLEDYLGELLARWGRWAQRGRGYPPSERTERIERALATAIAGSTVDALEPNATDAMREKAVLMLADEYLGKSATPSLASDARKRAKNRRSRQLIRKPGDGPNPTSSESFNDFTIKPFSSYAASPAPPTSVTSNNSSSIAPRLRSISRDNPSTTPLSTPQKKPSISSSSSSPAQQPMYSSSLSTPRRKPSNDPIAILGGSSDRMYDRRGSSSSETNSDHYQQHHSYTSPSSSVSGSQQQQQPMTSNNPFSRGYGALQAIRQKSMDNIVFSGSGSSSGNGGGGSSPMIGADKSMLRNPPYAEYSAPLQGGGGGGGGGFGGRRKKSADSVDVPLYFEGREDDKYEIARSSSLKSNSRGGGGGSGGGEFIAGARREYDPRRVRKQ